MAPPKAAEARAILTLSPSSRHSWRPGFFIPFSASPVYIYRDTGPPPTPWWPPSALPDTRSTLVPQAHNHTHLQTQPRVLWALLRTPGWNNGLQIPSASMHGLLPSEWINVTYCVLFQFSGIRSSSFLLSGLLYNLQDPDKEFK